MDKIYDSSFEGVFIRSLTGVLYTNQLNILSNKNVFTICKEQFIAYPVVLFTRKNFYLLEAIDKKIQIFQAAGLIEYWNSKAFIKIMKSNRALSFPTILTLKHLSGCFILLICGFSLSFSAFISELVAINVK